MSSHICLRVHFVWRPPNGTKYPFPDWEAAFSRTWARFWPTGVACCWPPTAQPTTSHLFVSLPATRSLAEIANALKANSSRWIHDTLGIQGFAWQRGYGAFSVSSSQADAVRGYIQKQKEHHRRRSFQEEYLDFLKRHGVEFDPRYVFE